LRGEGPIRVNLTAPDASPEQLEELAELLAGTGLQVEQTLPMIGVITGVIADPADLEAVEAAIADQPVQLERDREHQLPPPDDPLQ
jgi:hypothetical protein